MPRGPQKSTRFTKSALQAIDPPKNGRDTWYDVETRGLAFVVTAHGSRSFYLIRRVGRRVERVRLGSWPQTTIDQARRKASGLNGTIDTTGENPNDARRRDRSAPTLGELLEEYLATPTRSKRKRTRSEKTTRDYRWQFKKHLESWRERQLPQVTRQDVERLHGRIGREHGTTMANRVLALLKALYNYALDSERCVINPAARVRPFEERKRDRFLQAQEIPAWWSAVEAEPEADFFKVTLLTGARRSNVLAARWEHIDLPAGVWRLPTTKSGKPLTVPLSPVVAELLRARRVRIKSEWVFPSRSGEGPMPMPKHAWDRIRTAAGVPDLRFHDLRRSLASWQASTGANLSTIGKSLGHGSIEATKIYAHADLEAVRTSVERATEAIVAAAKKKDPGPPP